MILKVFSNINISLILWFSHSTGFGCIQIKTSWTQYCALIASTNKWLNLGSCSSHPSWAWVAATRSACGLSAQLCFFKPSGSNHSQAPTDLPFSRAGDVRAGLEVMNWINTVLGHLHPWWVNIWVCLKAQRRPEPLSSSCPAAHLKSVSNCLCSMCFGFKLRPGTVWSML